MGTAGSFFKNPIIKKQELKALLKTYKDLPFFEVEDGRVKITLAWILDHICEMKGWKRGNFENFEGHPLVTVTTDDATNKQ